VQPGNCWSFKGSKAHLFIKLAANITPQSFSIEHIPKEISLSGSLDSAPQKFSVYVKKNLKNNFIYLDLKKNNLTYFNYFKRAIQVKIILLTSLSNFWEITGTIITPKILFNFLM